MKGRKTYYADYMPKLKLKKEIISCEHCPEPQDAKRTWEVGDLFLFVDLLSEEVKNICPHCLVKLSDLDVILIEK